MLKKLVEISAGKRSTNFSGQTKKAMTKSQSTATLEYKARSLHFNARKAELERIERENQKIAKKIFTL